MKIKTNYWIDVRQAVVSLPRFSLPPPCFCSTPHHFDFLFHSLRSVFHLVCFGHHLQGEDQEMFFVLLWYCFLSVYSTVQTVSLNLWPFLNHWTLTFHCSCVLCFYPLTVWERSIWYTAAFPIMHGLNPTSFFPHDAVEYCKWHFDLKIWGFFFNSLFAFTWMEHFIFIWSLKTNMLFSVWQNYSRCP